jgi:hypothetical protein
MELSWVNSIKKELEEAERQESIPTSEEAESYIFEFSDGGVDDGMGPVFEFLGLSENLPYASTKCCESDIGYDLLSEDHGPNTFDSWEP